MTQIKRINADLIRENLPNPRHLCAIKNVAVLYNSIFQRSLLIKRGKYETQAQTSFKCFDLYCCLFKYSRSNAQCAVTRDRERRRISSGSFSWQCALLIRQIRQKKYAKKLEELTKEQHPYAIILSCSDSMFLPN